MKRLLALLILGALIMSQPACLTSTVTPARVESRAPSYDGAEATSGILAVETSGFVVTARFRARYNELVARYGAAWSPAIGADYGLFARDDGTWLATREAIEKALVMIAWARMGREGSK